MGRKIMNIKFSFRIGISYSKMRNRMHFVHYLDESEFISKITRLNFVGWNPYKS